MTRILLALVLLALAWRWARPRPKPVVAPAAAMAGEPHLMLWAWETPEDLRGLDARAAGVAFLAREVLLGTDMAVRDRRQPLAVADDAWRMAVVRVETRPGFVPATADVGRVAAAIAAAAGEPKVRSLQVDFDVVVSERVFYAQLLKAVRAKLPAGYPLSITALTSWCGDGSWLHGLPVDEAVPMFFRMGGPAATRATASRSEAAVREPLCAGSVGVATDEAWPAIAAGQRVYVFRSGAWGAENVAHANAKGYEGLRGVDGP